MRQRMDARLKERLSATQDEWETLAPKINTIRQLQMELRPPRPEFGPGGTNGMRGRGPNGNAQGGPGGPEDQGGLGGASGPGGPGGPGGPDSNARGGPDGGGPGRQMGNSPVEKAVQHLNELLRSPDSKADDIKAAVSKVREERAKAKGDLAKAQDDLKGLVTSKQEAILLAMGILE
jgi:hypothetical protein